MTILPVIAFKQLPYCRKEGEKNEVETICAKHLEKKKCAIDTDPRAPHQGICRSSLNKVLGTDALACHTAETRDLSADWCVSCIEPAGICMYVCTCAFKYHTPFRSKNALCLIVPFLGSPIFSLTDQLKEYRKWQASITYHPPYKVSQDVVQLLRQWREEPGYF